MKIVLVAIVGLFLMGASCTVKRSLNTLQTLKTDCEELEVELGGLGAEKLTPVIDKKVEQCSTHGFWSKKVKKKKQNSLDW